MKVLVLEWKSMGRDYIKKSLQKCGCELDIMDFPKENEDVSLGKDLTTRIVMRIVEKKPDFVFSTNYYPVAAVACQTCKIPYVAWCYDNPLINLYSHTIFYDTNYVFDFDRSECEKLREAGVKGIFHLPLAAATDVFDSFDFEGLPQDQKTRFRSDISFVGSLYTEKDKNFQHFLDGIDDYTKGFVDALIHAQKNVYGCNFLESALTERIVENLRNFTNISARKDGFETLAWAYANYILTRRLAAEERSEILSSLSQKYQVKFFTKSDTGEYPYICNLGPVDYHQEGPYVFKGSKINLNITLRSIQTGIPLRVFDIMGAGGFLLTNYQEEMLDHFVPDEDFVYYDSMSDLEKKVNYYLEHDEERTRIAKSGYEKVKAYHTYDRRIRQILNIVFGKEDNGGIE